MLTFHHVSRSNVTCHVSCFRCHVSCVTYHFFIIFTESAHWEDLVSKLQCLCVCVCATLLYFCYCLITPIYKDGNSIQPIAKRFIRKKLKKDIGLRCWNFFSKMVKNPCVEKSIFWSFLLICMDAKRNLSGHTTEFTWKHNRSCMDKQLNWLGHITLSFWGKSIHIYNFFIPSLLLRPKFYGSLSQSAAAFYSSKSYQGEGPWLWLLALVTCDRWHLTPDTWQLIPDTSHYFVKTVFLSANVERFSVSCRREFFSSSFFEQSGGAIHRWSVINWAYAI